MVAGRAMTESVAYLGLGTNLGARWANLRQALELLTARTEIKLLRCSGAYETEPWGVEDQPRFLNLVAEIATTLEPEPLLFRCKEVEEQLGREPSFRWGPRLIDVDILLYDDGVVDLPHLQIPHPRLHLRAFALIPLAELVPEHIHPSLEISIGNLAVSSEGREGVSPVGRLELSLEGTDC